MLSLRSWRRARNISQNEMATKLGVHVNTYQNWENEPEKITIANGKKIAEILGLNMDDISFEKEEE